MKKILHTLIAVALLGVVLQAVSHSEPFTSFSGSWVAQSTGCTVGATSGHMSASVDASNCWSYWNDTWSNDQESSITATTPVDSIYIGVTVRASGTGSSTNAYTFATNTQNFSFLIKTVAGVDTIIDNSGFTHPASGSIIKLKAEGTSLTVYDDGVAIGASPYTGQTDLTSGAPGVYIFDGGAHSSTADDWLGADVGGGGGSPANCNILLLGVGKCGNIAGLLVNLFHVGH